MIKEKFQELGELTAAGSTVPKVISSESYNRMTVQYTVTGVSGSVVVSAKGSLDDVEYGNLDENGSTTITSDGTYFFSTCTVVKYIRFDYESGTASNIKVSVLAKL